MRDWLTTALRHSGAAKLSDMKFANIIKNLPIRKRGWPLRPIEGITDITVHHAAAPDNHGPNQFAAWHTSGKGYPAIAYHVVITRDGTVHQCLPFGAWSSHNGYNNKHAIGVCLAGNFEVGEPTKEQLEALNEFIISVRLQVPSIKYLCGHREYPVSRGRGRTLCPGKHFDMEGLRKQHDMPRNPKCDIIHTPVKVTTV